MQNPADSCACPASTFENMRNTLFRIREIMNYKNLDVKILQTAEPEGDALPQLSPN